MIGAEAAIAISSMLLFGALYFVPVIVAYNRDTQGKNAVLVINVFLGWTFLGWVVALAMAAGGKQK